MSHRYKEHAFFSVKIATKKNVFFLSIFFFVLISIAPVIAAPDLELTYHGKLTDTLGLAVPNGNYDFTLTIYDAPTGGTTLWTDTETLTVTNGIFSTTLTGLDALTFDTNYYLGVTIGTNSEMTPRRKVTPTGFALNSHRFNGLTADNYIDTSATAQTKTGALSVNDDFTVNTDDLVVDTSTGRVGIGYTNPEASLHVEGAVQVGTMADNLYATLGENSLRFYRPGAASYIDQRAIGGSLVFRTSNSTEVDTQALSILANGNVGIGTVAPSTKMHVIGTSEQLRLGYDTSNYLSTTISATGSVTFNAFGAGQGFAFSDLITAVSGITTNNTATFSGVTNDIVTGTNEHFSIMPNGTGNVGIGTTTPAYKLDVAGIVNARDVRTQSLIFSGNSSSILSAYYGYNGYTNFTGGIGTGGIDRMANAQRITSTGNLTNIGSVQAGEMNLTRGGTFAAKTDYPTDTTSRSVATGDLNGDGKLDLAVLNLGGNNVSVLMNNGDGTYAAKVDYVPGFNPYAVALGDFNGDSKLDMVVTNLSGNTVSIFINNGNGTFAASVDYAAGSAPYIVAVGDLNGDGKADLVVGANAGTTISVLLNSGTGTFPTRVAYTTATAPRSVAIGDINGDSRADIVAANYSSTSVSVLRNNGDGTFAAKTDYTTGANPFGVAIGDLNGDGKADLAVTNLTAASVSVLLNSGTGTFPSKTDLTTATSPYGVAMGDFTGDGKADLAVANSGSSSVSVFTNNGNGTFGAKVDYTTGSSPYAVVNGDFNGDGKADLAVANFGSSSVSILLNQPQSMLYAQASTGNVGIGTTGPNAKLHVIATTEQLRLGYDASNYLSTAINSTGLVNFDAFGSGAGFSFADGMSVTGNILPSADDTYDLGSATNRFRDLYLGPSSLHVGETGDEGIISYDMTNDVFSFDKAAIFGTTTSAIEGAIRYNGTDFEGYDGTSWVSLTSTGGGVSTFLGLSDTPSSYTAGSLLFTSGTSVTEDNANLFWNDSTDRLGVGTNILSDRMTISGNIDLVEEIAAPSSEPTLTLNAVAGNLNGTYGYRVTYVDAYGRETASINSSIATLSVTNQQINLSNIPVSPNSKVVARRIYRNSATGSPYYGPFKFVATINDNVTTIYTDNIADSSLGTNNVPAYNETGQNIKIGGDIFMTQNYTSLFLGKYAGANSSGTASKTFVGYGAGENFYGGSGSATVLGYYAARNSQGGDIVAVGYNALASNTKGAVIGIGVSAAQNNTAYGSIGIGMESIQNNSGGMSIGIGFSAVGNNTGSQAIGIGPSAARYNTGGNAVGIGTSAMYYNAGNEFAGVGTESGFYNTGAYGVGLGSYSMQYNSGSSSIGIGFHSLMSNRGNNTVGVGDYTLGYNVGSNNTALGSGAFDNFVANVAGAKTFLPSAVVPYSGSPSNTISVPAHGFGSTGVWISLQLTTTGTMPSGLSSPGIYRVVDANTLQYSGTIYDGGTGTHTFTPMTEYTNSTAIGYNAEPTASNQIMMGNTSVTQLVPGSNGVANLGSSTNRWNTVYAANGTINTSDVTLKTNITHLNYGLNELLKINPISFQWKDDEIGTAKKIGFSAQELQGIIPEVVRDNGGTLGVYYSDLIPVAFNAIKEQHALINTNMGDIVKINTRVGQAVQEDDLGLIAKSITEEILVLQEDANVTADLISDVQARMAEIEQMHKDLTDFYVRIDADRLVYADDNGDLTIEGIFSAQSVEAEKLVLTGEEEGARIGVAAIAEDAYDVFVSTTAVTGDSRIFVTPRGDVITQPLVVTRIDDHSGFHVTVAEPVDKPLAFDWMIVEDHVNRDLNGDELYEAVSSMDNNDDNAHIVVQEADNTGESVENTNQIPDDLDDENVSMDEQEVFDENTINL